MTIIKKIQAILRIEFQRQLTYRVNFFAYRFSSVVEILGQLIVWTALFAGRQGTIQGYTYEEMMTYVLIGWLFSYFTVNYNFERNVSAHITKGELSMFLLKPQSYLFYAAVLSVGRISVALATAMVVQLTFTALFFKVLVFSFEPLALLIIAAMLVVGYWIKMAISLIMGALSFWFTEVDGVHSFIAVLRGFFSGSMFPLTLLSGIVGSWVLYNPLAYTFFVPVQLFLGKMTLRDGVVGLGIEVLWLCGLLPLLWYVWQRGLRKYEGVGV